MTLLAHEEVRVVRGARSGLAIVVAVHSTRLGQAVGGCRMWRYATWEDALADALRLSAAMTEKCALAGLPHGGGKAVIALPPDEPVDPARRRAALLDLGDVVASFDGRYGVGEDVGTSVDDMAVVRERTAYAYGQAEELGGCGDPSVPTARGVIASLRVVCEAAFGSPDLAGRRLVIVGLGHVGGLVARGVAEAGAALAVTDVDDSKRALAEELGAAWLDPADAATQVCDVLVPAALGGLLTHDLGARLRCRVVCGPANNQLAEEGVADALHARGILWAPDFVVNAGGVVYGTLIEVARTDRHTAMARVDAIGETLRLVLDAAASAGITPLAAARAVVADRLAAAGT